ncbi:MAG TPA: ATP-grasp domain-containing protein [Candidatus Methylomirabilis sp.]|nr:ATP-grasp domain-containing protein [Candidatus Methylomirabilis sp.]
MTETRERILVVCPTPRDRAHFSRPEIRQAHDLEFWGTDEETHEPGFDGLRFLNETIRAVAGRRSAYRAVVGIDDFPACLMAALIAEAIGLPSPSFESLFLCQHKYYSRLLQREAAPDATPTFHLLNPSRDPRPSDIPMALPVFVKPVKSYLSILARRIDTFPDLCRTVDEARLRLAVIAEMLNRFVEASRLDERFRKIPGSALLVEELLSGHQVTLDGYVYEGQVVPLGVVDSFFYQNGVSFERFEYPSRIPAGVQDRMARIAEQCIERIGLDRTFFNAEFFYRPEDDAVRLIEINGRMASQFAPLYRMIHGIDTYAMQLDLALGRDPHGGEVWTPARNGGMVAASFVLRRFKNGVVTQVPGPEDLERFAQRFPEAFVEILVKPGERLSDELQDDYSYRYALIDLAAKDREAMLQQFDEAKELLPFAFEPIFDPTSRCPWHSDSRPVQRPSGARPALREW